MLCVVPLGFFLFHVTLSGAKGPECAWVLIAAIFIRYLPSRCLDSSPARKRREKNDITLGF